MKILCTKILRENGGKAFVYDPDISEGTKIHCAWGEHLEQGGMPILTSFHLHLVSFISLAQLS